MQVVGVVLMLLDVLHEVVSERHASLVVVAKTVDGIWQQPRVILFYVYQILSCEKSTVEAGARANAVEDVKVTIRDTKIVDERL